MSQFVISHRNGITSVNSEVTSYATLRNSAGDPAGAHELALLDQFISQGKKDGWWTQIVEFYPWLGTTVAGVSVKAKYYSNSSLTLTGFADSDFADISKGFGTDTNTNTTKYAVANCDPVAAGLSQTDLHCLVNYLSMHTGNASGDFGSVIGIENVSTATTLVLSFNQTYIGFYTDLGRAKGPGIELANYTSSTYNRYHNGSLSNDMGSAKTGQPTTSWGTEIRLYRQTWNSAIRYAAGRIGTVLIGKGLTSTQCDSINQAVKLFETALGRIKTTKKCITFGDSITAGTGVSDDRNGSSIYAHKVAKGLGLDLINMGVGTSRLVFDSNSPAYRAGLSRYPDIFKHDIGKLVILYGTNDVSQTTSDSTFSTNLTNLLGGLTTNPNTLTPEQIILCSIPYKTPAGNATLAKQQLYLEAARAAAAVKKCVYADIWGAFYSQIMLGTTLLADGVHPNDAGHLLIANTILEAANAKNRNFIGVARGIDLNVTNTDRAIHIFGSKYRISKIVLSSPSADISATAATATIRDAAAGAGNVLSTVSWTGLSASTKANEQTVAAHDILTGPLYFRVGTGHGSAACVNAFVYGEVLE